MDKKLFEKAIDSLIEGLGHLKLAFGDVPNAETREAIASLKATAAGTPTAAKPAAAPAAPAEPKKRGRPSKKDLEARAKSGGNGHASESIPGLDETDEDAEDERSAIDISELKETANDSDDLANLSDDEDDLASMEDEDKEAITCDMLRTKLVEYAQKNTKEKAYQILAKFSVKRVNDLKPDQYKKLLSELQAGL